MSQRMRTAWVVMHYEIMGLPDYYRIDSIQFHVSSSLEKAEEYMRRHFVSSYSWWQIHPHVVDTTNYDEGREAYYYSHRVTRLKSPPMKRAIAAYRKYAAQHPEWYPPGPPSPR
ncbi:hypothetical protein ACYOEI_18450 [Singulisphaera rosea]